MRGIATAMAALAVVAAAAVPTPATASAPAATHERALASTCAPSSGTKTVQSYDGRSKGNVRLCVSGGVRPDGTRAITAHLSGDFFYYWVGLWYDDCSSECNLNGHFTLTDTSTGATSSSPYLSRIGSGSRNGSLTHTFEVSSGTYKISFSGKKYGGYWRDGRFQSTDTDDEMSIDDLDVTVDLS